VINYLRLLAYEESRTPQLSKLISAIGTSNITELSLDGRWQKSPYQEIASAISEMNNLLVLNMILYRTDVNFILPKSLKELRLCDATLDDWLQRWRIY
jgi:hypothetical protein